MATAAARATAVSGRDAWRSFMGLFLFQRDRFITTSTSLGLTPLHAGALRLLALAGPAPMRALAATLQCDASNVTGIVDRLEQRGLVERQVDPTDRRVKLVTLTPAGRQAFARLEDALFEPPAAFSALSERDQAMLAKLSEKLQRALLASGEHVPLEWERQPDRPAVADP